MAPDPPVEVTPWAEVWRADGAAFTTIFVVALLFRIAVLVQTAGTPYIDVANIDSESYQKWAREIVANGWMPVRNFYQSPFYAYFLAIIFQVFGDGQGRVRGHTASLSKGCGLGHRQYWRVWSTCPGCRDRRWTG